MSKKKQSSESKEIIYNIINSLLAGLLVLLGAMTQGQINFEGFIAAFVAALIVAVTQFKKYWESEEKEYCDNKTALFSFIR